MIRLAVVFMACACAALAQAPESSLRPPVTETVRLGSVSVVVPVTRPDPAILRDGPNTAQPTSSIFAASLSLRPTLRPAQIEQKALAKRRARRKGAVCGDPDIQGDVVGLVPGRINGCGVKNAVKVRSVSGVGLTQQSVMDCGTAKALKTWINNSAKPALSSKGGGLARLKVAAHYACRTRNNQKGAKISEHGKGRAIDISGFVLKNGDQISVLKGWTGRNTSKALRRMHKGACGPFGTVLGPNSDRFHKDHFHFDTARYRSGPFCR